MPLRDTYNGGPAGIISCVRIFTSQTNSCHFLWITGESRDEQGNHSPRLLYAADHVEEAVFYIEHPIIDYGHRPLQTWSTAYTRCLRYVSTVSRAALQSCSSGQTLMANTGN